MASVANIDTMGLSPEQYARAKSFVAQNPSATSNDVNLFLSVPADFTPVYYYNPKNKTYYVTQEDGLFASINSGGTYKGRVRLDDLSGLQLVTDVPSKVKKKGDAEAYNITSNYTFSPDEPSTTDNKSSSMNVVQIRAADGSVGDYQVDSKAYTEALANGGTIVGGTSATQGTTANPPTSVLGTSTSASTSTNSLGLTPNQQKQYDGLIAVGATPEMALSAAKLVPAETSVQTGGAQVVDTSTPPPGVDATLWAQLDPSTQVALSGIQGVLQQQLEQNQPVPVTLTSQELQDLYKKAQDDPIISQYYGDQLKTAADAFSSDVAYLRGSTNDAMQQQQQQFENDRKALAEQQAAAGTAYSGFRGQAQKQLGDTQAGIVESSRRELQKSLDQLTKDFEAKYGTSATTPASFSYTDPYQSSNYSLSGLYSPSGGALNTLTGRTVGGVAGSQNTAKLADVEQKYQDLQAQSLQQQGATT